MSGSQFVTSCEIPPPTESSFKLNIAQRGVTENKRSPQSLKVGIREGRQIGRVPTFPRIDAFCILQWYYFHVRQVIEYTRDKHVAGLNIETRNDGVVRRHRFV